MGFEDKVEYLDGNWCKAKHVDQGYAIRIEHDNVTELNFEATYQTDRMCSHQVPRLTKGRERPQAGSTELSLGDERYCPTAALSVGHHYDDHVSGCPRAG